VAHGDDELVADEQADLTGLDRVLLVDVPEGLEHDEQRVGVPLDLGALVGADRVLHRQLMEVVEVGDGIQLVAVGVVQADPDEVVRTRRLGSHAGEVAGLEAEVEPFAVPVQRVVNDHRSRLGLTRTLRAWQP